MHKQGFQAKSVLKEREIHVKFNRSVYQALMMISQFGINMLVPVLSVPSPECG